MLYPQPQHFMPAPYPNPPTYPWRSPVVNLPAAPSPTLNPALSHALPGAEAISQEDRQFLGALANRRGLSLVNPDLLMGWVRSRGNFTVSFLGWHGLRCGIGIAKRNPAADTPDASRGRRIALARALFDLLQVEGRTTEPETATEC